MVFCFLLYSEYCSILSGLLLRNIIFRSWFLLILPALFPMPLNNINNGFFCWIRAALRVIDGISLCDLLESFSPYILIGVFFSYTLFELFTF